MIIIKPEESKELKIPQFRCLQTGKCCSHIRGMVELGDKKFIEENAYGKMPLVQLHPVEKIAFPLWDWEARRFSKWQHDADVDARIIPSRAILDLNTGKAVIVTYMMDADSCPFLKKGKCSIYMHKRAYICRLFPFNRGPFLSLHQEPDKFNMFGSCPAVERIMEAMPTETNAMVEYLANAFPDGSFTNAVQNDIVIEWTNKTIIELMKKKLVRPAMSYPYEFLKRRIENAEKIDLTDFLVESGLYTREEMDNLINQFDDNIQAKERIGEFLDDNIS